MQKIKKRILTFVMAITLIFHTEMIAYGIEIGSEADGGMELSEEGKQVLRELVSEKTILALVYLTESYRVMDNPDRRGNEVISVLSGQTVQVLDIALPGNGGIWYEIGFYLNDSYWQGFIEREYLVSSDEEFLQWERDYLPRAEDEWVRAGNNRDIESFPGSYQPALQALKNNHPNWIFVKMNTDLDWDTVIRNELGERSLVHSSCNDSWKDGQYSTGWYYASEGILKYYMDPRNYLTESYIFACEQLTYNATYHSEEAVQNILNTTFMSGEIPDTDKTYVQALYEIGSGLKVSPFHLACRILQEQGKGTSPLISGTYPGYEGFYNYFNVGASGNTDDKIITSGLEKARKEGWNSRYKSLSGGAKIISQNYILRGQDTLYLQKFDVDASDGRLYSHQYMQNIGAPSSEAQGVRKAYISTGALDNPFVFKIPVYNNMPSTVCMPPEETPELPFSDVEVWPGNWKYDSIKYVYDNGIMNGINGTTRFDPDELLTRAMFATVLYRMAGEPVVQFEDKFEDVVDGRYYSRAITWAYKQNIVQGMEGGQRYGVDEYITREQMAKMLMEYARVKEYGTGEKADLSRFPDKENISGWATGYMQWAVGCGMIGGKNVNGTYYLDPKGDTTRAECAAMLMRFMKRFS